MNDNQPVPNPTLREHVTQIGFNLTLSKSMIAVLDELAHNDRGRSQRTLTRNDFVGPARRLGDRGLVDHRHAPNHKGEMPPYHMGGDLTDYYRLTAAGWLVHDLLAEAGMVERVTSRKLRKLIAA